MSKQRRIQIRFPNTVSLLHWLCEACQIGKTNPAYPEDDGQSEHDHVYF